MKSVYFLGIGGTLMGSLALLAKQLGFEVSGSDNAIYPPMSTQLELARIRAHEGFHPSQLSPEPSVVVVGNAKQRRGVEAVELVLERKLNYVSAAEWLADYVLPGKQVIAVSGTHGKTTTTSMVAWLLDGAGLNPGFLVGGVPANFGVSARIGNNRVFVIEADEYDSSYFDRRAKFLHYKPDILLLNNLEFDHADIYQNLEAIEYQFHHLIRAVPRNGRIVIPGNDPVIDRLIDQGCWTPLGRVFVDSPLPEEPLGGRNPEEDVWEALTKQSDGSVFEVYKNGQHLGTVTWSMLGKHNVSNAVFALAAAESQGVEAKQGIDLLSEFNGVARRMQQIATARNLTIYDDFAHHPTAIRTTIEGLRNHVGDERIIAVVEPRTHTMSLGALRQELLNCCGTADQAWWFKGENISWDVDYLLDAESVPTKIFDDIDALVDVICQPPREPTHVILMSNGSFGGIYDRIRQRLS